MTRSDLRHGLTEAFPLCCVLRFTLEAALTRGRSEQCLKRGVRYTPAGVEYVPCNLRHDATLTHRESEHLLNLRAI